jgi:ribonuclease P protein component
MQGFPKRQRLLRHSDFGRVYSGGRRHFAAHITVFYLPRPEVPRAGLRVGFTVGKALGGAVERNRLKRRLREAVRLRQPQREFPADVVIHPKRSLLETEFSVLRNEVDKAFEAIAKSSAKEKLRR